ncbi:MAG: outer membrane lipoprotein chaperone LolA [Gammaproteobacteria bacterium]|nr:MAG: outer membrane lipoprotein chaperone LolA [Gammaproteobacteria bacterium]
MKLSFLRYILPIFFFAMTFSAHAITPSSELSALLNATRSMQADFTQTIYDNRGKAVQQSYGHMAIQHPGQFRWQVIKPIPQLIIANGPRLWIYDPDLEQVTIRSLHQTAGDTPGLLLSHDNVKLEEDYTIKLSPKLSNGLRWFILVPKTSDNTIAKVEMGFVNNQISQMQLQDRLGHTTLIRFKNVKINTSLPTSLFVLKAPANADVIDETRHR